MLAAAVRANAAVIVTFNLKDFPPEALAPYDITAVSPDDFLLDHLELYPAETLQCLFDLVASRHRPPLAPEEFLARFAGVAPRFVVEVQDHLRRLSETEVVLPPHRPPID